MILSIALALAGPHGLPDDCGVTHRYRFATIEDPYHCLRARTDATRRWLEAESARATSALPAPVIDALVAELTPLLRTGAPAVQRSSGRWYAEDPSTRHLLSWTDPASPAIAAELSSLDPAGHLGQVSATPTGVLFTWDADGDEVYDLYAAGPTGRPARLTEGVADAFAVVDDGILLVRHDATFRPNRVVLRTGARERTTRIEPDARFYLTISPGREPTLVAESATTTEIRLGTPRFPAPLLSRRAGANYLSQDLFLAVDHTPALFSTFDARKSPGWERALGELPSVPLPGLVEEFGHHANQLILREPSGALAVWAFPGPYSLHASPPHRVEALPAGGVPSFVRDDTETGPVGVVWSSLTDAARVFELDDAGEAREVGLPAELTPPARARAYQTRRLSAPGHDGTAIPYTLLWACEGRGAADAACPAPSGAPTVLFAYGAYGSPWDPSYDPSVLPLLDRGVVVAIGHVRGGGDLGPSWHDAGKLGNKQNTFEDVISVARALRGTGVTSRLGLHGMSAGGAMVGAVLNRAPELFDAAVADVPFVDALNTMLDPTLPLTITEYEEWGDPRTRAGFEQIRAWAPIEQVRPQAYPPLLAIGGWNDTSVPYWEPAKWILRLRDADTARSPDGSDLSLVVRPSGGHMGAADPEGHAREIALQWAFLLHHLAPASP